MYYLLSLVRVRSDTDYIQMIHFFEAEHLLLYSSKKIQIIQKKGRIFLMVIDVFPLVLNNR